MMGDKKIKTALISVYHKNNLDEIVTKLHELGVKIFSTGGTQKFISDLGIEVTTVESVTDYPSILGGRVKTLHPKIFGGILARADNQSDKKEMEQYQIEAIDLVIVDLYPFEATVVSGASEAEIIEKIDIGGISLIRAAAKNFNDVVIVPSREQYKTLLELLNEKKGITSLEERKNFALEAFYVSSHYDTAIFGYFNKNRQKQVFKKSILNAMPLRYGENPHQSGVFYGDFDQVFKKIHGKEISYNNLLDIEAAVYLIDDFNETTFAILKHNNACGIACRPELVDAWKDALAGDPVSAFGGILITNTKVDKETSVEIDKLFFEVIIAPSFADDALEVLRSKKNRIILVRSDTALPMVQHRSLLNGVIEQDRDTKTETVTDMKAVTRKQPSPGELTDMEFANKVVKHTKSNTIVLARNKQLLASGVGQTSRVDALKQAIDKARSFGFDLQGSVMASDAFFPFPDCVEIAGNAGITSVIQPGGSIRDQDSINYCDKNSMAMVVTGTRHFKH
ncbi:MAG: bifunctional phosphoribosylaminoimidazolecarboxamide formyltransferase/IMP cyclohydrolase [Bacteroidales bacterium]